VAIYEYQCNRHDVFEIVRPLGTAPAIAACPTCGAMARRIISLPSIRCGPRVGIFAAVDHADKSRFEPEVVGAPPPLKRRSNVVPLTPQLARLPRP
jgi:putative FmdB family regulatory protein